MAKRKSADGETNGDVTTDLLRDSDANDEFFMGFALNEARLARDEGEVPIGAVVVIDNKIAGSGRNRPIGSSDPTAHAEILALREAAWRVGNYRLTEATLYVTIEPCAMCAGALVQSRIRRLVYGAADPKAGFCGTLGDIPRDPRLNHRLEVSSGVLADECAQALRRFFAALREPPSAVS